MLISKGAAFYAQIFVVAICIAFYLVHSYMPSLMQLSTAVFNSIFQIGIGVSALVLLSIIVEILGHVKKSDDIAKEFIRVVMLLGYSLLLFVVLNTLGINITGLLVGAGFVGIVVGLAAQTTLGNFFSGISILYAQPFKTGDKIGIHPYYYSVSPPSYPHSTMLFEIVGTVKSIGVMYTKILKDDMSIIFMPNSTISQSFIRNYSRSDVNQLRLRFEVPMQSDIIKLKEALANRLSSEDFSKLQNIEIRMPNVSTMGEFWITITGQVGILDYERMNDAVFEAASEIIKKLAKKQK